MTDIVIGVDAGGSHTAAVVAAPDGRILGRADGAPGALRPGRADLSAAAIADAVRRAAARAALSLPARAMVVGAAGAGRELEQAELGAALDAVALARRVKVVGDGEIALAAAFGSEPGILIEAGTGSIAYARTPDGRVHRAGGYGWQMGDEGGGYWLGRRALTAAAAALDGRGEQTTLGARIMTALELRDFDDLVRWAAAATPPQVAALAPQVLNAAGEGELVARRAVEDAAAELAALVAALLRRFPGRGAVAVTPTGGLLQAASPVRAALAAQLAAAHRRARIAPREVDPAAGAARLAAAL